MGTGKEQRITITSSTKLSDDEIKAKVKEAEQYAAEDRKRKEEIDTKNQAETLVYETEKALKSWEEKLSEDEKNRITEAKDALSRALESGNLDEIKQRTETLTNEFHMISAKMYEQLAQQAAGGAGPGPGDADQGPAQDEGPAQGTVVDADYEVVDEEKAEGQ
jgi:molecular chaperone DnaK